MKELYKPIESAEIMAHSRKMELIVQSKVSKLRDDRRDRIQNQSYDFGKYNNKVLESVMEHDY